MGVEAMMRYDILPVMRRNDGFGEWVRWVDVEALIRSYQEELAERPDTDPFDLDPDHIGERDE